MYIKKILNLFVFSTFNIDLSSGFDYLYFNRNNSGCGEIGRRARFRS